MIKKIVINQNDSSDIRGIDENNKECFYLDTNHSLEVLLKSAQAQNFLTVPYSVQVLKPKPVVVPVPKPVPEPIPAPIPQPTPNPKTIQHTWKNGGDDSVLPTVSLLPNGHYLIKSDSDADCDGSLRIGSIDPVNGQSETSLRRSNGWKGANANCDSEFIPFFVLPMNWVKTTGDTKSHLGDMAKITYKDKMVYAIYADAGPNALIGEASVCAIEKLGFNPWNAAKTKVVRGIPYGVTYEVISGSANLSRTIDFNSIQAYGKELFEGIVEPRPTPSPSPTPTPIPTERLVCLDSGHSLSKPGARSNDGKVKEEILNEAAIKVIQNALTTKGIATIWPNPDPDDLVQVGKASWGKTDIMISWHHNSYSGSGNPYVCCMVDPVAPKSTKLFAQKCSRAIVAALKGTPEETKIFEGTSGMEGVYEAELSVINTSAKDPDGKPPKHILVEAYFLNKFSDQNQCLEATKKAALAVASVIVEELNV